MCFVLKELDCFTSTEWLGTRHFRRSYLKTNKLSKREGTRKVKHAYHFYKCADAVYQKLSKLVHAYRNYSLPKLAHFLRQSIVALSCALPEIGKLAPRDWAVVCALSSVNINVYFHCLLWLSLQSCFNVTVRGKITFKEVEGEHICTAHDTVSQAVSILSQTLCETSKWIVPVTCIVLYL